MSSPLNSTTSVFTIFTFKFSGSLKKDDKPLIIKSFGFLDIIQNYDNTPSSNLAIFSTAMSYFNLRQYDKVIEYLENFKSEDI